MNLTDQEKLNYCSAKSNIDKPECRCINFNDPDYADVFNELDKSSVSYDKVCVMCSSGDNMPSTDQEKLKNCPEVIINNIYSNGKKYINMKVGDKSIIKVEGFSQKRFNALEVKLIFVLVIIFILICSHKSINGNFGRPAPT